MNTAVVTGAGSGVGRAVALQFAAEGWQVALVGRRRATLAETAAQAGPEADGRVARFPCDVSEPDDVAAMGAAVLARFGEVDVLVNAAGINVPRRSFEALSIDDWHAVIATNLHGAYYCVRAFLPGMRERRTGTIVNINSDVGKVARDLAGAAYVASKFGLQRPDAADQRRGTRPRRPRLLDLSARHQHAAARQAPAAAGAGGARARCSSPTISPTASGWSPRCRRASSSTRFRCRADSRSFHCHERRHEDRSCEDREGIYGVVSRSSRSSCPFVMVAVAALAFVSGL